MKDIVWNGENISRFVLGTAQLGMDYGIANASGRPTEKAACEIVKEALDNGVNCFDTAQVYGDSEIVLGKCLKRVHRRRIKIVSKLSSKLEPSDSESIKRTVKESRQNLGVDQLWGLMLHQTDWLALWNEGLGRTLVALKKAGGIKYLGVSVYSVEDARRALENSDIQIIQVPCNAWDQRMKTAGVFELAKSLNKLCFVRSIYLQGLLIMSTEEVEKKFPKATEISQRWHKLAEDYGLRPLEFAIGFAKSLQLPLVIGVDNSAQIIENFSLLEGVELPREIIEDTRLRVEDEDIIIPSRWNILRG